MSININKLINMSVVILATVCFQSTLHAMSAGSNTTITGQVRLSQTPIGNAQGTLFKSGLVNKEGATLVGTTQTDSNGEFILNFTAPSLDDRSCANNRSSIACGDDGD